MQETLITCSMCGYTFDSSNHPACGSCPLQSGCLAVCCPNCGFETVDVNRSRLARWFAGILSKNIERSRLP
jgi:hypothetical protein